MYNGNYTKLIFKSFKSLLDLTFRSVQDKVKSTYFFVGSWHFHIYLKQYNIKH